LHDELHTGPPRSSVAKSRAELLERLRKIEGQVRGIQRMIEDDRYCVDVLIQVSAARAALSKVALTILENHTRGCVAQAFKNDRADEAMNELVQVLKRFMK